MTERQLRLFFNEAERAASMEYANQIDAQSIALTGKQSESAKLIRNQVKQNGHH
jgi:hypothetical protein